MDMEVELKESTSTGLSKSMDQYFAEFEKQALEWAEKAQTIQVTNANQTEMIEAAKEARLALKRIRVGIAAKHKDLKEDALRTGQVLDSIKRKLTGLLEPIEAHLQEQENFVEVQETKRKEALYSTRVAILSKLIGDEARTLQLGEMSEQVFDSIVRGYEAAQKEKAEAAETERLGKIETERVAQAQREKDRKEREELQAQLKITQEAAEKERLKNEAKLKEERDKRKALEIAAQKIKDEEEKARKEQAAADRKLKRGPDKERLLNFAGKIACIEIPKMKDEDAQKIVNNANILLQKVHKYITENAESL